jgi:anthranilate phosphoribosyltransferase
LDLRPIIKEIGRGARGARGLASELAYESFSALLRGDVEDVQLAAWWIAMRIKGENEEELAAFERAMQDTISFRIPYDQPVVVLPCYNGARQLPNLTPLLAWALAKKNVRVLLHGVRSDPTRVTTFELFSALQFPIARDAAEAARALRERGFVFTPLDQLHSKLSELLANRWRIGVRSTPHTVAKLLQPMHGTALRADHDHALRANHDHALRVVALTHGDYIDRLGAHLQSQRANAVVFRGCEGEPVLHPKRKVDLRLFRNGESFIREWSGVEAHDLPDTCDVATTVGYIREVISGARPMPAWIDWLAQEMRLLAYDNETSNDATLAR